MKHSFLKKLNEGFTLIELILAIAIIGILATLANVGYRSIIDNVNTSQAIADIYAIELILVIKLLLHQRYCLHIN